ncbi:hypothetical protein HYH02_010550 [Chlamydomonas schloesseri]|uniref:UBC core domain-containing protein n=1 Tax=Chlamydomonas schloesseri TaxID=2026947 RepID=A0A835TAR5_9CHLO|nr:hypothetical protein HYH02_010550 [Chlamydomonas schloesseri]|eukprot:KAG2439668.1 hypothetical protein HYH02_010550 [Chlamydomonas schloesseri]
MAEAPKFNLRNPAVKRIMQEIKEIKQDTSGDFLAEALESDIFEWHFVIRGPRDTEFEGGIYHGRILLPAEYPFKPPSFMMLTPNGRFETNMKICLSISSHHPEHWQPSWSVRTALMALIAFMPTPGNGALGAIDFTKDERRILAARSRTELPRFGSADRQRVIEDMHGRMLAVEAEKEAERAAAAQAGGSSNAGPSGSGPQQQQTPRASMEQQAAQRATAAGSEQGAAKSSSEAAAGAGAGAGAGAASPAAVVTAATATRTSSAGDAGAAAQPAASAPSPAAPRPAAAVPAPAAAAAAAAPRPAPAAAYAAYAAGGAAYGAAGSPDMAAAAAAAAAAAGQAGVVGVGGGGAAAAAAAAGAAGTGTTDHMLTALMWALYVGIGAILLRKVMGAMGVDLEQLMRPYQ